MPLKLSPIHWLGLVFFGGIACLLIYARATGDLDRAVQAQARKPVHDIHLQVAIDAVQQYDLVEKSGTQVDRCVQAGIVAAAFLQAKAAANYADWKRVQSEECAKAGVRL